jgi:hypothetical protein
VTRIPDSYASTGDESATPPKSTDDLVFDDAIAESEDITPAE